MSFNLMEYLQEETQNGLLTRCYVNYVAKIVTEYKDSSMQKEVKRWDIDDFRVMFLKLKKDDPPQVVYDSPNYILHPCNHTQTTKVTVELIGGEVERSFYSCNCCGIEINMEEMEMSIDWKEMEMASPFVRLEKGTSEVTVSNWRLQEKFKNEDGSTKVGFEFDCLEKDGMNFNEPKSLTLTAMKAINQLTPILKAADAAGKTQVRLSILKAGDGPKTVYEIKEM